jgi:hypothetical protein
MTTKLAEADEGVVARTAHAEDRYGHPAGKSGS